MTNTIFILPRTATRLLTLSSTTAALLVSSLVGCRSVTPAPALGAVSADPQKAGHASDLAEILVEGDRTDRNGIIMVNGCPVVLSTDSPYESLKPISDFGFRYADFQTQYATLQVMLFAAVTPTEFEDLWNRYARFLRDIPAVGAAAMTTPVWVQGGQRASECLIESDIQKFEAIGRGLSADCGIVLQEIMSRGWSEAMGARREYDAAQGPFNDNEDMIQSARYRVLTALCLNRLQPNGSLSMMGQILLRDTRGDLWSGQANAVASSFEHDRDRWTQCFATSLIRAARALELYHAGIAPSAPRAKMALD